tara:strand:+ start:1643 stop:1837 length:195 start_codon:yes stop_codon:yes gene_type:complete
MIKLTDRQFTIHNDYRMIETDWEGVQEVFPELQFENAKVLLQDILDLEVNQCLASGGKTLWRNV